MQNYEALHETTHEDEARPPVLGVAEPPRSKFSHVDDLDDFFQRMYAFHQGHGYVCMMMREIFSHVRYAIIALLMLYVFYGINYNLFIPDLFPPSKHSIEDIFYSFTDTLARTSLLARMVLAGAIVWFVVRVAIGFRRMFKDLRDTRDFYRNDLKINDWELGNVTWHQVQTRVREVQPTVKICIHKKEISDLDIHHRILRHKNFMVALVNKGIFPPRFKLWFLGDVVYWTPMLQDNIELLLFGNSCTRRLGMSLFEHSWQVREQYKRPTMSRSDNVQAMRNQVLLYALLNLLGMPIFFVKELIQTVVRILPALRRDPSILSRRRWSCYSLLWLRHYNELDHEVEVRLNRAIKPSNKYMSSFFNPLTTVMAEMTTFISSAFISVMLILGIFFPEIYFLDNVVIVLSVAFVFQATCSNLSPDEAISTDRARMLQKTVHHTHYMVDGWSTEAHTDRVRSAFQQLFQYTMTGVLETLIQPIMIPYILIFVIKPCLPDILEFFRCFTINVTGVGDVCSFAQMDIRKHGHPDWHQNSGGDIPDQRNQGENGKVELSLAHFSLTNPDWSPPTNLDVLLQNSHMPDSQYQQQQLLQPQQQPSMMMPNFEFGLPQPNHLTANPMDTADLYARVWGGGLRAQEDMEGGGQYQSWRVDEPLSAGAPSFYSSTIQRPENFDEPLSSGMWQVDGRDQAAAINMSMSAEIMHNRHSQRTMNRTRSPQPAMQETTPLLSLATLH